MVHHENEYLKKINTEIVPGNFTGRQRKKALIFSKPSLTKNPKNMSESHQRCPFRSDAHDPEASGL